MLLPGALQGNQIHSLYVDHEYQLCCQLDSTYHAVHDILLSLVMGACKWRVMLLQGLVIQQLRVNQVVRPDFQDDQIKIPIR